ncbi:uncharacterized protein J7T54_005260 [Emericellopsis cladophorae]|uniref:Uncharacterized protein n=1 Tax=Emericellopsis cladophorae TaxID=2686198 RepID=A0A9Q0BES6_9HYPO|nr:uncharacterized protein J7T54_005260 [Emericellopsis cladophorae]KAI6781549.1 hypothetical protein J7T54_005260 [Emericellopsis cladophorae]
MGTLRQAPPESLLDAPSKGGVFIIIDDRETERGTGSKPKDAPVDKEYTERNQDDSVFRIHNDVGDMLHDEVGVGDGGITLDDEVFEEISTLPLAPEILGKSFKGPQELLQFARCKNHAEEVAILPGTMAETDDELSTSGNIGGKAKISLDQPPFSDIAGFSRQFSIIGNRLDRIEGVKRKAAAS